ncbi:hypothetical protein V2J09_004397 [Rumex salicifolius]
MDGGGEKPNGALEWRINVPSEASRVLVSRFPLRERVWLPIHGLVMGFLGKIQRLLLDTWKIGVNEPRKLIHCLKVSLALSVVSLFYYMRPLYTSVGGNAMWAIMTVVVVFEYTVGATLSKCINRTVATILGGSLGFGVHWIASQSGKKFEPIVLGASVFIFAGITTFSRFIPKVKARFDYGALIFILTFNLVSVSGYRVDSLLMLAHQRALTIMIGTSLCIIISMVFCPVWAGNQLHNQIIQNLEKLANSLEACVEEYFMDMESSNVRKEDAIEKLNGYKCVVKSKAAEDSMANFARWEPGHGQFNFGHPWKLYLRIGAKMRNCAYCIDNLNNSGRTEVQMVPESLNSIIEDECLKVSSCSSKVLKELAGVIRAMKKSPKIEILVSEMNFAVQQLQNALKTLPKEFAQPIIHPPIEPEYRADINGEQTEKKTPSVSLFEALPMAALVALLTETVSRIEDIIDEVNDLARVAFTKFSTSLQFMGEPWPKNLTKKRRKKVSSLTNKVEHLQG